MTRRAHIVPMPMQCIQRGRARRRGGALPRAFVPGQYSGDRRPTFAVLRLARSLRAICPPPPISRSCERRGTTGLESLGVRLFAPLPTRARRLLTGGVSLYLDFWRQSIGRRKIGIAFNYCPHVPVLSPPLSPPAIQPPHRPRTPMDIGITADQRPAFVALFPRTRLFCAAAARSAGHCVHPGAMRPPNPARREARPRPAARAAKRGRLAPCRSDDWCARQAARPGSGTTSAPCRRRSR